MIVGTDLNPNTEYHVTLRYPMTVKLGVGPERVLSPFRSFDGAVVDVGVVGPGIIQFRMVALWGEKRRLAMKQTLLIPIDNIAGIVAQPFEK